MLPRDSDDPPVETEWCAARRADVADYLKREGVAHGRIGEWPAWHIAPYVSIWAIESRVRPESVGWWVIAGDLPTDYISSAEIEPPQHPRKAVKAIAARWLQMVHDWNRGEHYEGIKIAGSKSNQELAPLLESRARLLIEWADDDSFWEEA
jgi:hypothetical protein